MWTKNEDGCWEAEVGDKYVELERVTIFGDRPALRVWLEGVFWFDLTHTGAICTDDSHTERVRWDDMDRPRPFEAIARDALAQTIMNGPMKEAQL